MEVLNDDQALQAVLGRTPFQDLGIDNGGLDFQQLEDYITNDDMGLPEEAISAVAYGNGRPDPLIQNDLKLNVRLSSHPNPNSTHQPPSHPQTMYCNVPTTRLPFDPTNHHLYKHHTPLPDSPPDSGSEPYSPPDGNQHMLQDKAISLGNPVTSIPGPMYPHHRPLLNMPSKGPPPGNPPGPIPGGYMTEPPKLNHLPPSQPPPNPHTHPNPHQMTPPLNHPILSPHFGSMNNIQHQPNKKRKYPDSPNNTLTPSMLNSMGNIVSIKQEPPALEPPDLFMRNSCSLPGAPSFSGYSVPDCSVDDDYSYDVDGNGSFMDTTYQVIKWQPYNPTKCAILTDGDLKDIPNISYRVDADKGFNFSVPDDAFVCQKKNHFQVTVHIGPISEAKYVRTPEGVKKVESFHLHFHGIKVESPSQYIKIEQSQSDRSKKSFYPVKVDLNTDQVTKVTVGRLHFSETTSNNMRKKGKPNPDQRYFMLVVSLHAHSSENSYTVAASSSERIIVRASNPGQFDSDVDVLWSKGHTQDSVFHIGRVGVNTDHPDEAMTIHGNLKLTGHLMSPSDIRAKENLEEVNTKESLQKVQQLRLYKYQYSEDYAETAGLDNDHREDTGVIAQEMLDVLPDAVKDTGDVILPNGQCIENFLVVRKDRLFMENVGAVKELCKLTDNLENRIDELEHMNKKLAKLKRFDSLKSNVSYKSGSSISTVSSTAPPKKPHSYSHSDSRTRYKHSRSSQPPPGRIKSLCSNRFIQITIIILILIMAFCLVAITTLYILERHKPETRTQMPMLGVTQTSTKQSTRANPTDAVTSTSMPRRTSSKRPPRVNTTTASTTTTTTSTTTTTPTVRVRVVPPYPVCDGNCEPRCCSNFQEDEPMSSHRVGPHVAEITTTTTTTTTKTTQLKAFTIDTMNGSLITPIVINNAGGYNVVNNDDHVIHRYKRQNSDDLRPEIVIKQLNFTIGPEYCQVPGSCEGPNNTYFAYISSKFGPEPITLQFKMRRDSWVSYCADSYNSACTPTGTSGESVTSSGTSQWNRTAEFNLSIGTHHKSTYRFRISPDKNPQQCNIAVSSTVYEYILIFRRQQCGEQGEMDG